MRETMKKTLLASIILLALLPAICFAATNTFDGFQAEDYLGNPVTVDIFKDYDVTMVNIFTTWCGFCMREMPDIEKLSKNLPARAHLIGICADAYESPDDLTDIVDQFGLDFPIVKMQEYELDEICDVLGYPTTVFVDKSGKIIDVVAGAQSYTGYLNYVKSLLKRV